jgi:hypothetical protein
VSHDTCHGCADDQEFEHASVPAILFEVVNDEEQQRMSHITGSKHRSYSRIQDVKRQRSKATKLTN